MIVSAVTVAVSQDAGPGMRLDIDLSDGSASAVLMCECGNKLYAIRPPCSTVDDLVTAIATHRHRDV